jgi:hypothetical protein
LIGLETRRRGGTVRGDKAKEITNSKIPDFKLQYTEFRISIP